MTFTFSPARKMDPDEVNPWDNLLSKALKSYNEMTDARYKEPNLREALRKAQLYNQYYGPGKESTMALQGAQAGHARSLTQGQDISNQFAPEAARQAAQARKFGLEHPGFNNAGLIGQLQQYKYAMENGLLPNMPGNQNQPGGQSGGQTPPQGMQSPENQGILSAPQGAEQSQQNPMQRGQQEPMNPILQSILQKSAPKETPEQKEERAVNTAQRVEESKKNTKTRTQLEHDIPEAQRLIQKVQKAIESSQKHPEWYGPGTLGFDTFWSGGPSARKRSIRDVEFGPTEATLGQLVGPQAKELSGNKILATGLGLAKDIKPSLGENPEIAIPKLQNILADSQGKLQEAMKQYAEAGGDVNKINKQLEAFTEKDIDDTAAATGLSKAEVKRRLKKAGHLK